MHATIHDPFNDTKTNSNKNNLIKITKSTIKILYPEDTDCLTCGGPFEQKQRPCLGKCPWRPHRQYSGSGNNRFGYICFESSPGIIYMRRWLPYWLYDKGIEWIFRTNLANGLVGHHINFDEFDDRSSNISLPESSDHNSGHFQIEKLQIKLYNLFQEKEELKKTGLKDDMKYLQNRKLIMSILDMIEDVKRRKFANSPRLDVILKEVPKAIEKGIIYKCPPEWKSNYTPPRPGFKRGTRPDVLSNSILYK